MASKKSESPDTEEKVDATTGDPKYDLPEKPTPEPERKPPPIHEPVQPYDPIPEPVEGDQDLGKRAETTPGRQ
jgi:hypothetical protein